MKKLYIKSIVKTVVILFLFLGTIGSTYSQNCFGATASEMAFSASTGSLSRTIQHNCSGGTFSIGGYPNWLTNVSISGTFVTATVSANTGGAHSGTIQLLWNGNTSGGILVSQVAGGPVAPGTPPMPSISKNCGYTRLTRANPPTGVTYYWQTSSGGTSTANSNSYVDRTSGTTYYLKAKSTNNLWSTVRTISYTIDLLPGTPLTPTVESTNCNQVVLKRVLYDQNSGNGNTWYWQSSANGISTSNTSETISLTSGSTYYLRSRNNTTGCWSANSSYVSYSFPDVTAPLTPTFAKNCGSTVLTRANPPSGYTYYWQSTTGGTSTSNSNITISQSTGGTYYLKSRENSTGCWSTHVSVSYSVDLLPGVPSMPSITENCGNTVLTRSNPPSGYTYYWQSSTGGTSTSDSGITTTRTSGTSYYLRSRNNTTNCWSTARTITYAIDLLPGTPLTPTVESTGCNQVVLKRILYDQNSGNGNTWYWQSIANGISTSNTNEIITLTSGSIYYLRSRNNTTGCWSTNSSSVSYSFPDVAVPPIPTFVKNCGSTVLTRANPPSGFTYYWQSSAGGTSTSNSTTTISQSTGGTYYLKSREISTGCWSTHVSVSYSVDLLPNTPSLTINKFNDCGNTVLTRTVGHPSGYTYYWQSSASGENTNASNSNTTVTLSTGSIHYLRLRNNTTECWSTAQNIPYILNILPGIPLNPTVESTGCEVVLKRILYDQNSGNGNIWYWQSIANGTSTLNTNETITVSEGSVYYLRSKNTASGCWSANSASVSYTVDSDITWHKDEDGDGYEDPNGTVISCEQPTPYAWYKLVGEILGDDCDDTDPTLNPDTVWFPDTDGDDFPDSLASIDTALGCTAPTTGTWTHTPENSVDNCPNSPYNDNYGCNPNCNITLPTLPEDLVLDFDEQGGTQYIYYTPPNFSICPSYELTFGAYPEDWLTITPDYIQNRIIVECNSYTTSFREASGIAIYANASIQFGGIKVRQNYTAPPLPTCEANPISNITLNALSDSEVVTVSFVNAANCSGTVSLKHPYENNVPGWLNITPSGNTFTLSAGNNNSGGTQTTILAAYISDGQGNDIALGVSFIVTQASCLTKWYVDTDNDGLGDVYGTFKISCDDPDDTDNDPGISWVANNDDLCPLESGTLENNGCPAGTTPPENWNTIATQVFDITGTPKGASKSYFDELGKAVQSQSLDIKTNRIWVGETLYDSEGRPAVQTLSAPTDLAAFEHKDNFTLNSNGTKYTTSDFEGDVNNPSTIAITNNTLGWYYSEQNTDVFHEGNNYQDVTDYPFSRTIYSKLNPGSVLRVLGGNKVTVNGTDQWTQGYAFSMRASQELSQTIAFGETKYNNHKIFKTVSRDIKGIENVVFTDADGKTLAAARSGGSTSRNMTIEISEQGYVDIHAPLNGNTINANGNTVVIHDLITEEVVSSIDASSGFVRVSVADVETYDPNNPVVITYKEDYYDYSLNEYDITGRLTASYQPIGTTKATKPVSTYEYNTLGQLIKTTSPDGGDAEFKYREDGQIRYSQNSKQLANNEFSYTNYDTYGRPKESGVIESTLFSTANADDNDLPTGTTKEVQLTTYDSVDSSGLPLGYTTPSFLAGNVAKTENDQSATYYSYDIYGRVKWMVQDITGLGVKTIDYEYDPITGQVTYVYYQKDDDIDRFIHKYMYDTTTSQLTEVYTSLDDIAYELHATYEYYEKGGLKRKELAGGLQGIDYVYNLAGQLKSINHPSLDTTNDPGEDTNDLFGMQIDYHNADYKRTLDNIKSATYGTDQLNGNIKGVRWNNREKLVNAQENVYSYTYNRNNWLQAATYGTFSDAANGSINPTETDDNIYTATDGIVVVQATESITLEEDFHAQAGSTYTARIGVGEGFNEVNSGDYNVSGIDYDANGNIQHLKRNKHSADDGKAMDDLTYTYKTDKPNQLLRVDDGAGNVTGADDLDDQTGDVNGENYHYNSIGQLIEDWEHVTPTEPDNIVRYTYNASGLVTEVSKNNVPLVMFFYNDRGHRVRKESYNGAMLAATTTYVRDASGNVMAIYDKPVISPTPNIEHPIEGQGRIGVFKRASNTTGIANYELTDHLGNVRAVFTKNTVSTGDYFTDYYPGGMPMPGRNIVGDYRYSFQGQELDKETGKIAFELRLYDPRIMRWLTTDPAGQYDSPYLAMGNNPISRVDPDGGFDWYVNNDTGELEWHNTSASIDGLTWVGTNSASNDYLSGISQTFGGSGSINGADILRKNYYDITNGFNDGLGQRGKDFVSFVENPVGRTLQGAANFVDGTGSFLNDYVASGGGGLGLFAANRLYDGASNMTLYDWSYAAGYSAPDIALSFAGGYALSTVRIANGIRIGNVRLLTNFNNKLEGTLFQIGRGKNFRVDMDWRNGLHYHRRGTAPGQGIGRHRPWQTKSTDTRFWNRF